MALLIEYAVLLMIFGQQSMIFLSLACDLPHRYMAKTFYGRFDVAGMAYIYSKLFSLAQNRNYFGSR